MKGIHEVVGSLPISSTSHIKHLGTSPKRFFCGIKGISTKFVPLAKVFFPASNRVEINRTMANRDIEILIRCDRIYRNFNRKSFKKGGIKWKENPFICYLFLRLL